MRKTIAVMTGIVMLGASAASATAGEAPAAGPPPSTAAKPAAAHPHVVKVKALTGQVVSVDESAKTVTVKPGGRASRAMTFTLDKDSTVSLSNLKPGERVRVSYQDMDGHLVAKSITPTTHTASK